MKKDGFTLVELMAVIAIIAVLSVVVIPSLITVNKSINDRLYKQKIDNIESAAELYASNNPDIFNGADRVYVTVYQLIDADYLEIDTKTGQGTCDASKTSHSNGCITDPRSENEYGDPINDNVLNDVQILLVKKNVGVTASIIEKDTSTPSNNSTLVEAVCNGFETGSFDGYSTNSGKKCKCNTSRTSIFAVDDTGNLTTESVDVCMIVSNKESGDVDNWLKYGSTQANWRVLGLYKINDTLYPKMITSDVVQ